jgi:peptidoglycan L-alanyl-D-glutamate endopeptidase CwlK
MDAISTARLGQCNPELARRVLQLYAMAGVEFRITAGLRTWATQAALYAQGRTAPGSIVTDAMPGYSWHEMAMAADFVPMNAGVPIWNTADPTWGKVIAGAPACGLLSGSTWTHFTDIPHLQFPEVPLTPTDEDRADFLAAGMGVIWSRYASIIGA